MKNKVIAAGIIGGFAIILISTAARNMLLSFFLVGILPGTHIIVPFWFMMAAYTIIASFIVAHYIEAALRHFHAIRQPDKPKTQPQPRRYSPL